MKKIIVTGFEAFLEHSTNPTEWLAKQLDGQVMKGAIIQSIVLPVAFERAVNPLIQGIEKEKPDAIIMLGLAAGRKGITPERVAINVMDGEKDNDGEQKEDEPIDPSGPAAYFSTLPLREVVAAATLNGCDSSISNTAGTYVCNCLMYSVLRYLDKNSLSIPAGFIHVPYSEKMNVYNQPALPEETLLEATRHIINCVVEEC
ncbi:pyroglutamyl-peptidase I [Bacillus sp. JCM 19041]|uniref:pyroglutamyl-peptidase I n=1 Tax=Bacillus sp. JCM 19041 TaxID=1460637 RepID=UPI0006D01B85